MRPKIENSLVVLIDMQQRLCPVMCELDMIAQRQKILLQALDILKVDLVVTEQYPQGLGPTLCELSELFPAKTPVIEKKVFSAFGCPQFRKILGAKPYENIIFCGVESHVCVAQSVYDALERNYNVYLLGDAVSSRNYDDKKLALKGMRHAGAHVCSVEALLFMFIESADHPAFKAISKLIK